MMHGSDDLIFYGLCAIVLFWFVGRVHWIPVEPRCRKCGYITRGLPSNVCPECGTNLSLYSPIRGRARFHWPLLEWLGMWSVLVLLLCMGTMRLVEPHLPRFRVSEECMLLGVPQSRCLVRIFAECSGYERPMRAHTLLITTAEYPGRGFVGLWDSPFALGSLRVDVDTKSFRIMDKDGKVVRTGDRYSEQDIRQVLSMSNPRVLDIENAPAASDIAIVIETAAAQGCLIDANGRLSRGGASGWPLTTLEFSGSGRRLLSEKTSEWAWLITPMCWAAIWAGGVWAIIRWRRRTPRDCSSTV